MDCSDPATVFSGEGADAVTCGDARMVAGYLALIAGRPASAPQLRMANEGLAERFARDPSGTASWLERVRQQGLELRELQGNAAIERRVDEVWRLHSGEGLVSEEDGILWNLAKQMLSVWVSDEATKVALTEADIEAWIAYASLCREVQNAGTLRLSVADRVSAYKILTDKFAASNREQQVALTSLGPFWEQVKQTWKRSPYERQQRWITAAVLPPPMTATSLGYAEAVLEADPVGAAATVHETLGPFVLARGTSVFDE